MLRAAVLVTLALCAAASPPVRAAECLPKPAVQMEFNSSTPHSLNSPDKKWRLYSIPGHTFADDASLFLALADTNKKWRIVWMHDRGTGYFSDDSHWLIFRDDYVPDDSAIRAFDLSGSSPKELKHMNLSVRSAMQKQIPRGMFATYVHYPDFCFATPAAGAPTTFILLADTPVLVRPTFAITYGNHPGKGAPYFIRVEVTLPDARATAAPYHPAHTPAADTPPPPNPN
jgi:hypothetical protein